jgi:hypothetical protein
MHITMQEHKLLNELFTLWRWIWWLKSN